MQEFLATHPHNTRIAKNQETLYSKFPRFAENRPCSLANTGRPQPQIIASHETFACLQSVENTLFFLLAKCINCLKAGLKTSKLNTMASIKYQMNIASEVLSPWDFLLRWVLRRIGFSYRSNRRGAHPSW